MEDLSVIGIDLASPHHKPGRWQHPTRCQTNPKIACASGGVHSWKTVISLAPISLASGHDTGPIDVSIYENFPPSGDCDRCNADRKNEVGSNYANSDGDNRQKS